MRSPPEGRAGLPSRGLPRLRTEVAAQQEQQRLMDDDPMMPSPVMPKYVATGTTPPSVVSDTSSDEVMQVAKAESARSYHQEQLGTPMPTIAEDAAPSVGAASSRAGSAVPKLPTPRTLTARAIERMTLDHQPPSESD